MRHLLDSGVTLTLLLPVLAAVATEGQTKLDRRDFTVQGRRAFIIGPSTPSSGPTPWVLYAPTLGDELPGKAEEWMFRQFVEAGICIAGVDVGESYGSPAGRAVYTALHRHLTLKEGFACKACLLARSRGGLMLYGWAMENPDKVSGIAGIYPVCNLASYPGVERACTAYGMTEAALSAVLAQYNPIDRLAPLAKAGIPIYHIHGDANRVVPLEANSGLLSGRYRKLGGKMHLQIAKGQGHNMWEGFFHCQGLVDFAIESAKRATRPYLVFLLGGQSNMDGCGRAEELPEALENHPDNVVIWDNQAKAWAALEQDSFATARNRQFGPEMAFGHRLAQAYPQHNIAMVKTSAGGTKLHTQWTPGKVMYRRFTRNYDSALAQLEAAGCPYEIAGMLWMQGESDSETLEMANAYEENLELLVRDVRRRIGNERLPFVMGRISSSLLEKTPWNFDHARIVQQAQEAVAARDADVHIINTDGLSTLKDNTHFDTPAQLKLGEDMAHIMIHQLQKHRGHSDPIPAEDEVVLNVNWRDMLSDHDMIWTKLPSNQTEAPHLGNGAIGSMVWFEKGSLRLQVYRADVHDHRDHTYGWSAYSRPRYGIGHFILKPKGTITGCDLRLDIYNAQLAGTVTTDRGAFRIRHFVHYRDHAIFTEITPSGEEGDLAWQWHPEAATTGRGGSPAAKGYGNRYAPYKTAKNPEPVITAADDVHLCVQNLSAGGQYATAWKRTALGANGHAHVVTIANTYPQARAAEEALAGVRQAMARIHGSLEAWITSHQAWWHDYYPASFVTFPETIGRTFYWNNVYRLACCTRPDAKYIDTPGMWNSRGPWPYSTHDFNTQAAHWPVYASNRLDLGKALVETVYANRANLIENVVPSAWQEDSAFLPLATAYDLRGKRDGDMRYYDCLGCLTWVLHNCWLQYRYTMDDAMLREKVYPILRRSINCYRHLLCEGDDGTLHLSASFSPELGVVEDCNFDLALLKWGCRTLIDTCQRLQIHDPLVPEWKRIVERLTEFPVDEHGFMMGSHRSGPVDHQHMSHLMMIYPLYLVTVEQPGTSTLLEKSVRRYDPTGMPKMAATQSSPAAAALGLGNLAHKRMFDILYRDTPHEKLGRNGIYYLSTPCIETSLGFNTCVHEMMIQSWGGVIRVFPAMPDVWANAAFHNFRTEGAFLVSAVREAGRTRFVRIESLAGEACMIRPALDREPKVLSKRQVAVRKMGNGVYALDLRKGESVILYDGWERPSLTIEPMPIEKSERNFFGLNWKD